MKKNVFDLFNLKQWFIKNKRDLPWRRTTDPYAIWVSEIMLQQTQVAVVIPYFLRWMKRFPTIESLACATLDEVIKMWEGLGYYSRARNLHCGAQWVMNHAQGRVPHQEETLKEIKGLGPYTIGAILSFAFRQKKAAVDGNVRRVLARYFKIEENIDQTTVQKKLEQLAQDILPNEEPWVISEGLIELGATICQKKPQCSICPVQDTCQAYRDGLTSLLPIRKKRPLTTWLYRAVLIIQYQNTYLIKRGPKGKIMSDLHEFPYFEVNENGVDIEILKKKIQDEYALDVTYIKRLSPILQSFTRYQVRLEPFLFSCTIPRKIENLEWKSEAELQHLAFSSGHRRLWSLIVDSTQLI